MPWPRRRILADLAAQEKSAVPQVQLDEENPSAAGYLAIRIVSRIA
jgi:hypothetical protein